MHKPQRDLRPLRDWDSRNHIASEQTQIAGECGEKPFRPHVGDFDVGCERIAGSAMEFKMNREATSRLRFYAKPTTRPKKTDQSVVVQFEDSGENGRGIAYFFGLDFFRSK